jgi:hypothetical protein
VLGLLDFSIWGFGKVLIPHRKDNYYGPDGVGGSSIVRWYANYHLFKQILVLIAVILIAIVKLTCRKLTVENEH